MESRTSIKFDKARHVKYWKRCASLLPDHYISSDASRMSLGFFIVSALDLLDVLESEIEGAERSSWIEWIYSCQVPSGGFRGFPGTNLGVYRNIWNLHWDPASLPNTYLALLTLLILGDDLGRVKKEECVRWIGSLQRANGSFGEYEGENGEGLGKSDMRTCYCAVGTVYILNYGTEYNEKLPFNDRSLRRFVANCQNADGGCGQSPLLEAHSGLNFCAIATIACLDRLRGDETMEEGIDTHSSLDFSRNVDWMLQRQTSWVDDDDSSDDQDEGPTDDGHKDAEDASEPPPLAVGFNGRLGKMADTCYCFWNGGALAILDHAHLVDRNALRQYLCDTTQHMIGGFSKAPGAPPDVMHSYTGLAALAVYNELGLKELDPVLAVSRDAAKNLGKVAWRTTLNPQAANDSKQTD